MIAIALLGVLTVSFDSKLTTRSPFSGSSLLLAITLTILGTQIEVVAASEGINNQFHGKVITKTGYAEGQTDSIDCDVYINCFTGSTYDPDYSLTSDSRDYDGD